MERKEGSQRDSEASRESVEVMNAIMRLGGMMERLSAEEKAVAKRALNAMVEK